MQEDTPPTFDPSPMIEAYHRMRQASVERHIPKLLGIDSEIVAVGQEESQLDDLISRAIKARHAMGRWAKSRRRVFLGTMLFKSGIAAYFVNRGIEVIEFDFKAAVEPAEIPRLEQEIDGALVLLNNNDLLQTPNFVLMRHLYVNCPNTVFAAWLWDNHHMVTHSAKVGLCVDLLYTAHYDNLQILHRFCPFVRKRVPVSSFSWTKEQAQGLAAGLGLAARPIRLSGGFYFYSAFEHRNVAVRRMMAEPFGSHLKSGERVANDYVKKAPEEQWSEWASSKVNLIVPVLSDLPIRFFDALLTGNIPLLPRSLAHTLADIDPLTLQNLPVVWYDYADLADMSRLVDEACDLFDAGGAEGIYRRHRFALDHHMAEDRIESVLDDIAALADGSRA
jgi:hypothetical protein